MTPHPADSLTVLTCTPGHRCAKLYADPAQKPEPYDAGSLFGVEAVPVASLAELAEALDGLRHMPECMVIRDALRPGAVPSANGLFARRRVDRPGDPAPFEHAEHRWACLDADATAVAFDSADPTGSVERWRATLPAALQGAAMVFQFSAQQHLSPTVRGHCWIWLAEPVGNVPLARWCTRSGIDPALFHAVQPHYTADPLFAEGQADPLEPRALVVLTGSEAVELDFTEADYREADLMSAGGVRLSSVHLAEVGEPSALPEAVAARAIIAKQFARAFDRPGKRWDLCGHIGGACANAGAPPEECCAILEALRAGDVADHDFAQGLQWALGAYSYSARPLGLKGIAALCGPVAALQAGNGLRTLGEIYCEPTPEEEAQAAEPEAPWGSLPLEEFGHDSEPGPIAYICEGLNIGPGKPSGCVAYANNSKTPWALEFAVHVAAPSLAGAKFQGHAIERQVRVLYVASEGARNARRKLAKICKAHGLVYADLKQHLTFASAPPGWLTIEAAAELGERAVAQGYGLVVVDTYNSAFDGSKDRNTNDFSQALKVLGDISDRADVTFLTLLHTRKGDPKNQHRMPTLQDIDGHNSIAGALQCAVGLWRLSAEDKHTIGVCCIREVDAAFDTYTIKWTDVANGDGLLAVLGAEDDGALDTSRKQAQATARAEEKTVRKLLEILQLGGSTTIHHFTEKVSTGLGRDAKRTLVSRLEDEGLIVVRYNVGTAGQDICLAPNGPKAAEARAKYAGLGAVASGAGPPKKAGASFLSGPGKLSTPGA